MSAKSQDSRKLSSATTNTSLDRLTTDFSSKVFANLKTPMLSIFSVWAAVTVLVAVLSSTIKLYEQAMVLVASVCSIIGTLLILFSAVYAKKEDRNSYQFVYYMTTCDFLLAFKFCVSACMVLSGRSLDWQERREAWCVFAASIDQFAVVGSLMWNAVILFDLAFLVYYPMTYRVKRQKFIPYYHLAAWSFACLSFLIPLFSPNAIGMSADDSCWVLGVYVWCYYAFWYCFVILAIVAVIAIYKKLNGYTELSDSVSTSYVKVVSQSALIVFTYFLAWFWCAFFVITFFSQRHWSPYWLFILQIFWLGYVGTGNAVVWLPNIIKAIKKATAARRERYEQRYAIYTNSQRSLSLPTTSQGSKNILHASSGSDNNGGDSVA